MFEVRNGVTVRIFSRNMSPERFGVCLDICGKLFLMLRLQFLNYIRGKIPSLCIPYPIFLRFLLVVPFPGSGFPVDCSFCILYEEWKRFWLFLVDDTGVLFSIDRRASLKFVHDILISEIIGFD